MTDWPKSWDLVSDLPAMPYFGGYLRNYWRSHVKPHFSKTITNYFDGAARAHETFITYRSSADQGRLQDALSFMWYPDYNSVNIRVKPIMVYKFNKSSRYDLIKYLSMGTRESPRRYIVALNKRPRWAGGERAGTTNEQWIGWWNEFVPVVDNVINRLADNATRHVANKFESIAAATLVEEI